MVFFLLLSLLGIRLPQCHSGTGHGGLYSTIDSDTPTELRITTRLHDGSSMQLVMSDEFNTNGRRFEKGQDSLFEAVEKPDNSNQAIQFCNDA